MINLALVGIGAWGKNFLKEVNKIDQCEIKYICAPSVESKENLTGSYIKLKDVHELLNYNDIDGVIIASPGSTHFKIAFQLLEKGYNLFIEKPMTTNYQDALKLHGLFKKRKSIVLIGHIYLYNPAILKVKELLHDLGTIQYITFEGLNHGVFRSDISALWEWAPHGVSICLDFLKQKPLTVSAWVINRLRPKTKLYDLFLLNLEFPNNVKAIIKGGWLYPVKKRELIVVGVNNTIVFDDCLENKKITVYENICPSINDKRVIKNNPKVIYPKYDEDTPLSKELLEFISCIKNNKTPKTDINHGVEVVKIINLAEESIQNSGQKVHIN